MVPDIKQIHCELTLRCNVFGHSESNCGNKNGQKQVWRAENVVGFALGEQFPGDEPEK